jgi:hypothetical protein
MFGMQAGYPQSVKGVTVCWFMPRQGLRLTWLL